MKQITIQKLVTTKATTLWKVFSLVMFTSLYSSQSAAQITSAKGTSSNNSISLSATSIKPIQWRVIIAPSRFSQVAVRSQTGIFFDSSFKVVLGRIDSPIVRQKLSFKGQPTSFSLRENLRIPQTVVKKARSLGLNQIIFQRVFFDSPDNTEFPSNILFQLSSGTIAGQLNIERIQVEFENQRTSLIIPRASQLNARAIIKYKGTGLFQYRWEIASPPSTKSNPIFFPLIVKRQYLLAGDQATIQSPDLPTDLNGNYLIRLMVTSPEIGLTLKVLRYSVKAQLGVSSSKPIKLINLLQPQADDALVKATEFAWHTIEGSKAYQLELYSRPPMSSNMNNQQKDKPITGVLMPANTTRLKLSGNSFNHLSRNQTYYWRVIALSDSGEIVGQSEFRRIKF
ncbi:MAG: hypothetical protein Q9M92_03785 [Enterobacterales bacterium]|nr:hypothetical protein [Enterobacterales bacterium]